MTAADVRFATNACEARSLHRTLTHVNKLLRSIWTVFRSRFQPKVSILDTTVMRLRVRPTDMDVLWHMNNGVYFSIADLGRYDLLLRSGVWKMFRERGWYPVVASSTIAFRKSLDAWMRYELHTRMVGVDERNVYLEQRFVVDGDVYARLYVRGRFLKRSGGQVPLSELKEALGQDFSELRHPDWLERWSEDVALPSPRTPAPNDW